MKRKIVFGLLLVFLAMLCFAYVANAASVAILIDDEESLEDLEAAESVADEDLAASRGADPIAPAVRWTYPVSLTSLYSPLSMLVNNDNLLQSDFEPNDLVKMTVKRATSAAVMLDKVAGAALEEMFEAAKEAGYKLFLKSGYRSYGTQKTTYMNRLASNNGKDDGVVAPPGASEHQTGLACDILNEDYAGRPRMTTDFSETQEAQWMKENCAEFGFILRYPEDKQEITKIIFEPWHFRYVGKDVASYIMRQGITLEEFCDDWQVQVMEFQGRGGDVDAWIAYEAERLQSEGEPAFYLLNVFDEAGDQEISISF